MARVLAALSLAALVSFAAGCYDLGPLSGNSDGGGGAGGGGGGAGGGGSGGGSWSVVTSGTTANLRGVFGGDGGDLFAVGASSTILRLGATTAPAVEKAPPGYNLRAVWSGGGAAFAVGDTGIVLARGVSGWDGFSLVDATFFAVTPATASDPLVVGSAGTIMEHVNNTWTTEDGGVSVQLRGAFRRPGGDVLVVGDSASIVRGDGTTPPLTWTPESSGAIADLYAVWASATDSFAVGTGGVILHATAGDAWAPETSGTSVDLFGVFGAGDIVYAVGAGGTIVARKNGAWVTERTGGPDLRGVWAATGDAWAVGDGGTILHRAP